MPDDVTCRVGITSANMMADSFGHKEKTVKLCRNSCCNGVIWCKKVTKMVLYVLIHIYVPFYLEKTTVTSVGVMATQIMDVAGQLCGNTSADT